MELIREKLKRNDVNENRTVGKHACKIFNAWLLYDIICKYLQILHSYAIAVLGGCIFSLSACCNYCLEQNITMCAICSCCPWLRVRCSRLSLQAQL